MPPASEPAMAVLQLTCPPLEIVRVPAPATPTLSRSRLFQVEPAPSTVTRPVEPALLAISASMLLTCPPALMLRAPLPDAPIVKGATRLLLLLFQMAPAP